MCVRVWTRVRVYVWCMCVCVSVYACAYVCVLCPQVWDRPFCTLFPEQSSLPGRCTQTPPTACTSRQQWCDATHPERSQTMKYIQSLLLLQLLRVSIHFMESPPPGKGMHTHTHTQPDFVFPLALFSPVSSPGL